MDDIKSMLLTKTLWLNLLGPVFAFLATKGVDLDPDTRIAIVTVAMAGANIVMRRFTKGPAAFTAPVSNPPPPTASLVLAVLIVASLSACAPRVSPSPVLSAAIPAPTVTQQIVAGTGAAAPGLIDMASAISPKSTAAIAVVCPYAQDVLAIASACASGGAAGSTGAIAQISSIVDPSCTEAGRRQLEANDAAAAALGPTPTNSGDSAGFLLGMADKARAIAPWGCPFVKAFLK